MKEQDLLIVSQLRTDGRKPLLAVSTAVHLCRATVAQRLQRLQKTIIRKYTALVDFQKLGFSVRVLVTITLEERDKVVFERYIQQHPALNNLYKAREGYDYILEIIFENKKEAEGFLSRLEDAFAIRQKHVFFIEKELVRESFFTSVCFSRGSSWK